MCDRSLTHCCTLLFAKATLLRLFVNIDMPEPLLLPYHPPNHVEDCRREKKTRFTHENVGAERCVHGVTAQRPLRTTC
jgi:hypothetical protein